MSFTHNNDVRLHWQERGTGTPVLLIMGARYSSRMWYPVIPALALKHRVIYFDNRGTGQSGTSWRFEVRDMADDALAVMNAAGVESAHVYGVSLGGGLAMELAMQQPQRVRSLILGCTAIKTASTENRTLLARALYYLPQPLLNAFLRIGASKREGSAADAREIAMAQDVIATDLYSTRGVAAQAQAVARYTTTHEAAAKLTMPALVLHGDEDGAVPYRAGVEIAKTLPNARLETFNGAGHNYFLANAERANQLVLDFLQQVDATMGPLSLVEKRSNPTTHAVKSVTARRPATGA